MAQFRSITRPGNGTTSRTSAAAGSKELIRVYKEIDDRDAAIAYAEECQQNFENGEKPRPNGNAKAGQHYQREVEATYSYCDASGQVAFEVVRSVSEAGQELRHRRAASAQDLQPAPALGNARPELVVGTRCRRVHAPGTGKDWISFNAISLISIPPPGSGSFNTAAPVVPYQLPDLLKAVAAGQTICIAEGEKKVDLIRSFGFPATCCAGGAKKWRPEHSVFLKGADVVLLPDNDPVGREHVTAIAESLSSSARRIRVLELPNLPEKGDVVDWHAAGGSAEEFASLIAAAPDHVPDESAGPQPLDAAASTPRAVSPRSAGT